MPSKHQHKGFNHIESSKFEPTPFRIGNLTMFLQRHWMEEPTPEMPWSGWFTSKLLMVAKRLLLVMNIQLPPVLPIPHDPPKSGRSHPKSPWISAQIRATSAALRWVVWRLALSARDPPSLRLTIGIWVWHLPTKWPGGSHSSGLESKCLMHMDIHGCISRLKNDLHRYRFLLHLSVYRLIPACACTCPTTGTSPWIPLGKGVSMQWFPRKDYRFLAILFIPNLVWACCIFPKSHHILPPDSCSGSMSPFLQLWARRTRIPIQNQKDMLVSASAGWSNPRIHLNSWPVRTAYSNVQICTVYIKYMQRQDMTRLDNHIVHAWKPLMPGIAQGLAHSFIEKVKWSVKPRSTDPFFRFSRREDQEPDLKWKNFVWKIMPMRVWSPEKKRFQSLFWFSESLGDLWVWYHQDFGHSSLWKIRPIETLLLLVYGGILSYYSTGDILPTGERRMVIQP